VYAASSLSEQSTPAALAIEWESHLVNNLTFYDYDLDVGEIGGSLLWDAPGDVTQLSEYIVYLSGDSGGPLRSLIGKVPLGTNRLAIPSGTPLGEFFYFQVYTSTLFLTHATPAEVIVNDTTAAVSNVSFIGKDLNLVDLTGTLEWIPPTEMAVFGYNVYIAADAYGLSRLRIGSFLPATTRLFTVNTDIFRNATNATELAGYSHFVIFCASVLGEQTTPVALSFSAAASKFLARGVGFIDDDLDLGHLGGTISWSPPLILGEVTAYDVYLAQDVAGTGRSFLGSTLVNIPVNETSPGIQYFYAPAEIALASFTHCLVYSSSTVGQSDGSAAFQVSDTVASVSSIVFMDDDLDVGSIGGTATWTAPSSSWRVQAYSVYLAMDALGAHRSIVQVTPVGTNQGVVPADTQLEPYSHLVVYTRSVLVEQTTPVATTLSDNAAVVSNVVFSDRDLDAGDIGGNLTFSEPADTRAVSHNAAYLAKDANGTDRS
jgi:hypothetical protein